MNKVEYVSASQMSSFCECPRAWWARYVSDMEIPEQPDSEAIKLGLAVHKILELSLKARKQGIEKCVDPHKITPNVLKRWELEKSSIDSVPEIINNAIDLGWYDGNLERIEPEGSIKFYIGDLRIGGRVDKLEHADDYTRVIDIKTGRRVYALESLKENWQAKLYSLPYLEESEKVQVEFWFVRFPNKRLSIQFTDRDKSRIEDSVLEVVAAMEMADGEEYCPNQYCKWCSIYEQCKSMKGKEISSWSKVK